MTVSQISQFAEYQGEDIDFAQPNKTAMATEIARCVVEYCAFRQLSEGDAIAIAAEISAHSAIADRLRPADRTIARAVREAAQGKLSPFDKRVTVADPYDAGNAVIDAADATATLMENAVDYALNEQDFAARQGRMTTTDRASVVRSLRAAIRWANEHRYALAVSKGRKGRINRLASPLERFDTAVAKLANNGWEAGEFDAVLAQLRELSPVPIGARVDVDVLIDVLTGMSYGLSLEVIEPAVLASTVAEFNRDALAREGWACDDCTVMIANGDASGVSDDDRERWEAGYAATFADPNIESISVGTSMRAVDCSHVSDSDLEEHSAQCDTEEFSRRDCDVCGSTLDGRRHGVTFHYTPEPVDAAQASAPVDADPFAPPMTRVAVQVTSEAAPDDRWAANAPWSVIDVPAHDLTGGDGDIGSFDSEAQTVAQALEKVWGRKVSHRSPVIVISDPLGRWSLGCSTGTEFESSSESEEFDAEYMLHANCVHVPLDTRPDRVTLMLEAWNMEVMGYSASPWSEKGSIWEISREDLEGAARSLMTAANITCADLDKALDLFEDLAPREAHKIEQSALVYLMFDGTGDRWELDHVTAQQGVPLDLHHDEPQESVCPCSMGADHRRAMRVAEDLPSPMPLEIARALAAELGYELVRPAGLTVITERCNHGSFHAVRETIVDAAVDGSQVRAALRNSPYYPNESDATCTTIADSLRVRGHASFGWSDFTIHTY